MGYIYKISNNINNKIYIGQTINDIEHRFKQHINQASNQPQCKFHCAIKEIGSEHFYIEKIEQCNNELLDEREQYWIKFYDSVNNGYNTTWGGSKETHYDREKLVELWNKGFIIKDISNKIGIDRGLLGQILKTEGISETEINKRRYDSTHIQIKNRSIYQIDPKTGKIIKEWFSVADAERNLNIQHSIIIKCCKKIPQAKTAGGFAWRYKEDYNEEKDSEELIQYTIRDIFKNTKHILKFNSNNELIKEYESAQTAAKFENKTAANIRKYCRGERKDPNGYIWKYK